ncbi:MAG: hypothetical protein H5T50_05405 [Nitrososphaeria archaeon]|nr:hypothetical protein [Nitrososphaeria archaeon]
MSEDEIKKVAETKLWIEERIKSLEREIEALRETLAVIDSFLLQKGFRPAEEIKQVAEVKEEAKEVVAEEVTPLKAKDGRIIATAYISSKNVIVVPASSIKLKSSTPPFTSYLMGKKLPQMVEVDRAQVKSGMLKDDEVLKFSVEEDSEGVIKKISIENYRTKSRLKEILNLITWTFEKMLEKS